MILGQLVEVLAREERQVDREIDRRVGLAGRDQLGDEVQVVERMAAVEGQHRRHAAHDGGTPLRPELARVGRAVPDVDVWIDHPRHDEAPAGVDDLRGVETDRAGGDDSDAAVAHPEAATNRRRIVAADHAVADQEVELHSG